LELERRVQKSVEEVYGALIYHRRINLQCPKMRLKYQAGRATIQATFSHENVDKHHQNTAQFALHNLKNETDKKPSLMSLKHNTHICSKAFSHITHV